MEQGTRHSGHKMWFIVSQVQFLEDEKEVLQEEVAARSMPTEANKDTYSLRYTL